MRLVRREGLWQAFVGDQAGGETRIAGPGAARDGGRVRVVWVRREGQGM